MTEDQQCNERERGCSRPARMSIRVTRPTRSDLRVTAYADNRTAPKTALPYCQEHGLTAMNSLLRTVVDGDE